MRPKQELAGQYRLEQRLGCGGMGEVWRATDLKLDRQIAVKIPLINRAGDQADQALARFRREGVAAARLNHPHIAAVYGSPDHEGWPFLVLELLAGPDLAALLKEHPGGLPIETVLEYGAQAAQGLAAAHAAGVYHRDIKPSNLMLDSNGALKICDFGIARLQGATVGLTAEGSGIGTPAYMPPEQLRGKPVTGAADVYALGATLFQLLTGRELFPGDDLAVIAQHLHEAPPRPSTLRPAIPAALDTYLISLLAKDPDSRPTADTIVDALRALTPRTREQAPRTREQAAVLLADAERLARTRTSFSHPAPLEQAGALAQIAAAVGAADPAKAKVLLAEAEHLAHGPADVFTPPGIARTRTRALAVVARAAAEWDLAKAQEVLAEAEHLARTITEPRCQAEALADIAEMVAEWNPSKAQEVLATAEHLTPAIDLPNLRAAMVKRIASLMAEWDPAAAEGLSRTIASPRVQAEALAQVAEVMAGRDPATAEVLFADAVHLANSEHLADTAYYRSYEKAVALSVIANAMAAWNPVAAERVARTITFRDDSFRPSRALMLLAEAMAGRHPIEAERLARIITDPFEQAGALSVIAAVVGTRDPAASELLLAEAVPNLDTRSFKSIAGAVAEWNPVAAERLARTIEDPFEQAGALTEIAKVLMR